MSKSLRKAWISSQQMESRVEGKGRGQMRFRLLSFTGYDSPLPPPPSPRSVLEPLKTHSLNILRPLPYSPILGFVCFDHIHAFLYNSDDVLLTHLGPDGLHPSVAVLGAAIVDPPSLKRILEVFPRCVVGGTLRRPLYCCAFQATESRVNRRHFAVSHPPETPFRWPASTLSACPPVLLGMPTFGGFSAEQQLLQQMARGLQPLATLSLALKSAAVEWAAQDVPDNTTWEDFKDLSQRRRLDYRSAWDSSRGCSPSSSRWESETSELSIKARVVETGKT